MANSYKLCYKYNGTEYPSGYSVRQAIEKNENKRFGPEPVDREDRENQTKLRVEFWKQQNVEYSETEIVPPAIDPAVELVNMKRRKNDQVNSLAEQWLTDKTSYVTSSLQFKVNSNRDALFNVQGLIASIGDENLYPDRTIQFRDFDNSDRTVDETGLKTIEKEIGYSHSVILQTKWKYKKQIEQAEDKQTLNEIEFKKPEITFDKDGTVSVQ